MISSLIGTAYAQDAAVPAANAGGGIQSLLPLVLIFLIFYFIVIRPQQKKIKTHATMIKSLSKGDRVITQGGVIGTITKTDVEAGVFEVEIAPDVKVKVLSSTISDLYKQSQSAPAAAPAKKKK